MAGMMPAAPQDAVLEDDVDLMDENASNVSPEEQAEYEDFVHAGYALIYKDSAVRPEILSMLDQDMSDLQAILGGAEDTGKTPTGEDRHPAVLPVAATAVVIVMQLLSLNGDEPLDDELVLQAGAEIVEELGEVWSKANKDQIPEHALNQALTTAADLYREAAVDAGLVDEEALKAAFGEIVEADKQGRLGEYFPEPDKINKMAAEDAAAAEQEGAQ